VTWVAAATNRAQAPKRLLKQFEAAGGWLRPMSGTSPTTRRGPSGRCTGPEQPIPR